MCWDKHREQDQLAHLKSRVHEADIPRVRKAPGKEPLVALL